MVQEFSADFYIPIVNSACKLLTSGSISRFPLFVESLPSLLSNVDFNAHIFEYKSRWTHITEMNPSFYPKHLARQYAQGGGLRAQSDLPLRIQSFERPWAQVHPLPGGENSQQFNNNNKYEKYEQVVEEQVQEQKTMQHMSSKDIQEVPNTMHTSKKDKTSGNKLQVPKTSAVFSGLPPTFIEAMKKLYDMVDTHGEGRVRLEGEIKSFNI